MHLQIKKILVFLFLVLALKNGVSQIMYSPYSIFGVGEIEHSGFGVNKALGGTGIAFSSAKNLNNINPASYSEIDSLNVLYEMGIYFRTSSYKYDNEIQTRNDGNIEYMAGGLRLSRIWSASIGIVPYSKIDYTIGSTDHINGEPIAYDKIFTGDGGINQFYFGNSFKLTNNLVIGFNASLLAGSITKTETAEATTDFRGYLVEYVQKVVCPYIDFGVQYSFKLKDDKITLGAIYGPGKELVTTSLVNISTPDLFYSEFEDIEDTDQFEIPQKFGVGIAYYKKDKWMFGFDYEKRNWETIDYSNPLLTTRNSERFSMGLEILPSRNTSKRGFSKLHYRFGANFNKSYLEIDNIPINSFALTAGIGIPLKKRLNMMNISLEYGQNGTMQNGLMKEKYLQINLSLSLRDIWFKNRQYY